VVARADGDSQKNAAKSVFAMVAQATIRVVQIERRPHGVASSRRRLTRGKNFFASASQRDINSYSKNYPILNFGFLHRILGRRSTRTAASGLRDYGHLDLQLTSFFRDSLQTTIELIF
jgi:hypothetical protein